MSTEQLLIEARMVVAQAQNDSVMVLIGMIVTAVGTALWLEYVLRRWSWIPRKRHNRTYIEKF